MFVLWGIIFLFAFGFLTISAMNAAEITVGAGGTYDTIASAFAAAVENDTIVLLPAQTHPITVDMVWNKKVSLEGKDSTAVIQPASNVAILNTSSTTLSDISFSTFSVDMTNVTSAVPFTIGTQAKGVTLSDIYLTHVNTTGNLFGISGASGSSSGHKIRNINVTGAKCGTVVNISTGSDITIDGLNVQDISVSLFSTVTTSTSKNLTIRNVTAKNIVAVTGALFSLTGSAQAGSPNTVIIDSVTVDNVVSTFTTGNRGAVLDLAGTNTNFTGMTIQNVEIKNNTKTQQTLCYIGTAAAANVIVDNIKIDGVKAVNTANTAWYNAFTFNSAKRLTFSNIDIQNAELALPVSSNAGAAMFIDNVNFEKNLFSAAPIFGTATVETGGLRIKNNTMPSFTAPTGTLSGDLFVSGNTLLDISGTGIICSPTAGTGNIIISDNDISSRTTSSSLYGINCGAHTSGKIIIDSNKVDLSRATGSVRCAFQFKPTSSTVQLGNLILSNNHFTGTLAYEPATTVAQMNISGNTITAATGTGVTLALGGAAAVTDTILISENVITAPSGSGISIYATTTLNHTGTIVIDKNTITAANNASTYGVTFANKMGAMNINVTGNQFQNAGATPTGTALNFYASSVTFASMGDLYVHNNIFDMDGGLALQAHVSNGLMFRDVTVDSNFFSLHLKTAADFPLENATPNARNITVTNNTFDYSQVTADNVVALNIQRKLVPDPNGIGGEYIITGNRFINSSPSYSSSTGVVVLGGSNVFTVATGGYDNVIFSENTFINPEVALRLISPPTGQILDATSNYWGDASPDFTKVVLPLANMKTIPYYADSGLQNKITTFNVTVNFNDGGETPSMVLKYDINTDTTYSTLPDFLEKDYHYLKNYVYNPKTTTNGVVTGGTAVTSETQFLTTNDHTLYIDWAGKFAIVLGYKISGYQPAYINALTPDSKQAILIKIPAAYDETSVLLQTRNITEISSASSSTGFAEPTNAGTYYRNKNHAGCKFINVDFSKATNLTTLGDNSFASNEFQGDLVIPENIKKYGSAVGAFQGLSCTGGLRLPEISADSINIPGQAFMGARFGDSVLYIPSTIKTIDRRGFSFTGGIGKAVFAEGLEELYGSAFDAAFTNTPSRLMLPATLKRAGQDVFKDCIGLYGSTRLPYNLTTLGSQMFNACTNLRTIYLPDTVVAFGYSGGNMNAPHYVNPNNEEQCLLIFANKARYDEPWLNFDGSTVGWNRKDRSYGLQTSYELPLQFRLIAAGNPAKDLDPRGHYAPDPQLKLFNKQYDYERNNDSSSIMYEAWLRNPASALPPVPEMSGYTRQYANWSVNTSGIPGVDIHNNNTRISTDSAFLYAVYTPLNDIPYTVVHYTQNANKTYTLSDTVNLTGTSGDAAAVDLKTYPGYTWSGTTYEDTFDTASTTVLSISGDGSLVVRVYYDRTLYTVSYDGNTATSGITPAPEDYPWGTDVTVLANSFNKTGYYFTAWNVRADGTDTAYNENDVFAMPQANVTLYANWKPFLEVTFESNGGTPVASQTLRKGALVIEPVPPTFQHYTFDGWFVDNTTFNTPWNFQTDVVTKSMTLYAKWSRQEYYVIFHANYDTSTDTYSQEMPCHTPTVLIPVQFSKRLPDDRIFTGWNTQTDGKGDSYSNEAIFEIGEANADLYAQWTPGYTVFAKDLIAYQEGTSASGEPFPRPYFELSIEGKRLNYDEMLALDYYIDGVQYDVVTKIDWNGKNYADTFIYEIPFLSDHYYNDQIMSHLDSAGFFEQYPVTQGYNVTVKAASGAFLPMYAVSGTLENRQVAQEGSTLYAGVQETPPATPVNTAVPQVIPGTRILNVAGWPANAPVLLSDSVLSYALDTIHAEITAKPDMQGLSYLLRYYDLVDSNNGNIILHTADSSPVTIHLPYPYPSKMNESTPFKILHFTDVNRSLIKPADFTASEVLNVSCASSGIKFETKSFSPFALLYPSRWVIAADLPDTYYHGLNYSPDSVTVWDYYTDSKLVRDSDYLLRWDNNLNAGTATLTVTGKGVYNTLFETYNYRILPVPLAITVASDTINVGQAYQNITLDSATGILAENIRYTIQPLGYTVSTPAGIYPDILTANIDWASSPALAQNYVVTLIPGTLEVLRLNAGIHLHVVQNHLFEAGVKLGLVTHTPEPMPVTYTSTNSSVVRVLPGEDAVEIVGIGNAWIVAATPRTARYEATVDSQQVFIFAARQTLTFDPIPEKIFNDAPFSLSAKSSSGLPVVFDSLNPSVATVDPATGMVTLRAAGSAVLTAAQPGNDTYMPADVVMRTLMVHKADVSDVIIPDTRMTIGETLTLPLSVKASGAYLHYTAARPEIMISGNSIYSLAWSADSLRIDYRAAATDNFNALADSYFYLTVNGLPQTVDTVNLSGVVGQTLYLANVNSVGTTLRYSSPNESIMVIGNTLQLKKSGMATVTVTAPATSRYEIASATFTVTISESPQGNAWINFPPVSGLKVGMRTLMYATSNVGLPVTYTVHDANSIAVRDGNLLYFTKPGELTVTASTDATAQYNAASATQVFLVQADRKEVRLIGNGMGDEGRTFEWNHQFHLLTVDTSSFYISGDTDYYSLFYTAPSKNYYQNKTYAGASATYRNGQLVDSHGQLPTEPGTYDVVFINHNEHYQPSIPHIPGNLYYPHEVEKGMTAQMQIIPYTIRADSITVAGLNARYDGVEKDIVLTFDSNIPQDSGINRNRSPLQTDFRDLDYTIYFTDPYDPGLKSVNPPRAAGIYDVVVEFHGTENSIAGHYNGAFHYKLKIESSNPFDYHIAVCLGSILNDRGETIDKVVFPDPFTAVTVYAPVIVVDSARVPKAGQSIGLKVSWLFSGAAMDPSTTQVLEKTATFDGVSRRCMVPFTLKPPANMPGTHFTEFSLNQFGKLSENGTGLYAEDPKRQLLEIKIPADGAYVPPKIPSQKVTFTRVRNIAYGIQKVPVEVWSPADNVTLILKVKNPKGMSSTLESYNSIPLEKLDDTSYRWRLNKGANALTLNPTDPGTGFRGIQNFKINMSDVKNNDGKIPTYRIMTRVSLLNNSPYVGAVEASFESTLSMNDRDRYIVPFADQLDTVILNGLLPKTEFETIDFVNAVRYPNLAVPQGNADELSLSLGDSGVSEIITERGAKIKLMGGIYFVYTASDSLIVTYGVKGWTDSFICYVLQSGAGRSCVPVKVHVGSKWTRGMPFDVDAQTFGIQTFEKKLKIWGEYRKTYDVVRHGREVKTVKLNGIPYIGQKADSNGLKYMFRSSLSMVNRKALFKDRKTSYTLDLLASDTMLQHYQRNRVGVSLNGSYKHAEAHGLGSVVYVTPRVDSATYCYVGGWDGYSAKKTGLVLSGGYMGEKTKVFIEYRSVSGKLKRSSCRVLHGKERRDVKIVDPWTGSGGGSIMIPEKTVHGAEEYIVVLLPRIFDVKTREKLSPDGRFDVIIENGMGYGGKRDIFSK